MPRSPVRRVPLTPGLHRTRLFRTATKSTQATTTTLRRIPRLGAGTIRTEQITDPITVASSQATKSEAGHQATPPNTASNTARKTGSASTAATSLVPTYKEYRLGREWLGHSIASPQRPSFLMGKNKPVELAKRTSRETTPHRETQALDPGITITCRATRLIWWKKSKVWNTAQPRPSSQ